MRNLPSMKNQVNPQRLSLAMKMKIKIENLEVAQDPANVTDLDREGHATDRVTDHVDLRVRGHAGIDRGTEGGGRDLETDADLDQENENDRDIEDHRIRLTI